MSWRENLKSPGIQTKTAKPPSTGPSLWTKCLSCGSILYRVEIEKNLHCCLNCNYHFVIPARKRLEFFLDPDSFVEFDAQLEAGDPLQFKDHKPYPKRIEEAKKKSSESEAAIWGEGKIEGQRVSIGVFVFEFLGGSMGSVVGEKITRCFERALQEKIPAIVVSSSGGARMQEGIVSLMQMAKTCSALERLKEEGLPYISILAHPTTGGVAASFSMLGDLNIAEPEALIGFAGPRVIEQTIRQKLPEGFQKSAFLLEHGMLDQVVSRKDQRKLISRVLRMALHARLQKV